MFEFQKEWKFAHCDCSCVEPADLKRVKPTSHLKATNHHPPTPSDIIEFSDDGRQSSAIGPSQPKRAKPRSHLKATKHHPTTLSDIIDESSDDGYLSSAIGSSQPKCVQPTPENHLSSIVSPLDSNHVQPSSVWAPELNHIISDIIDDPCGESFHPLSVKPSDSKLVQPTTEMLSDHYSMISEFIDRPLLGSCLPSSSGPYHSKRAQPTPHVKPANQYPLKPSDFIDDEALD